MADPENSGTAVSTIASVCQKTIADFLAATTAEDCKAKDFLPSRDVQHMEERYSQWAGNMGALQDAKSSLSLECRLRDAPLVRDSILNTLIDLVASIKAATDIATGRRQNRVTGPLIIDSDRDYLEFDISSSDSDTSSADSLRNGRNVLAQTSEIQELILAIKTGLDSLFKASIFVRKFAPKDRRLRAAQTKPFDNCADVMYVKDRYPSIVERNETLAARLGEANARRRQYFKYRRDHHERLSTVAVKEKIHDTDKTPKNKSEVVVPQAGSARSVLTTAVFPIVRPLASPLQ